jgi:predicted nucleic acid-binding Zn ribbon protein
MVSNNLCAVCAKKTSNPKFCSRSCAAIFNNKKNPKRKPEGNCHECGIAISRSRKRCKDCHNTLELEKERKLNNIYIFQTQQGKIEKKLPHVFNSKYFAFENGPYAQLSLDDECETLIDCLLSLIINSPSYISSYDLGWLPGMLLRLLDKEIECYKSKTIIKLARLPIKYIASNLENWIWSLFNESYHPMLPVFALATSQFIERHLFGFNFYHEHDSIPWKIAPWINANSQTAKKEFYFLNSSTFKKQFTESIKGYCLICKIPDSACVKLHNMWIKDVPLPSNFQFFIERCYLSQAPIGTFNNSKIYFSEKPDFDIFADCLLPGKYKYYPDNEDKFFYLNIEIPIRWVTAVKTYSYFNGEKIEKIIEIPKWLK